MEDQGGVPFVDLRLQYEAIRDEIEKALDEVFDQSRFILGPGLDAFEQAFARYCGVRYAVGVASGTDALHLALRAAGIEAGDRVITVPNTAVPTVSAITAAGASTMFVEVDPATYTMDPDGLFETLRRAFRSRRPRIKAIIPVHLYGQCAAMDRLLDIAKEYEVPVIEDACQAHGAVYGGKRAGSLGLLGCFSFYPTKNLGAYGDGGMVVTQQKALYEKLRLLRNYGQTGRYHHVIKGVNSRLDVMQAVLLHVKLGRLDEWNAARRRHASAYGARLPKKGVILPAEDPKGTHVYHLYVVRVERRREFQAALRRRGIETYIHYPTPVYLQPAYRDLGIRRGAFPVAERCARHVLSLPMHPFLTTSQIQYVSDVISQFLSES
jgi:dTDP-4-amino-4,6-dideoxygalactose transaminase